jgi:hypothetical protein
MMTFDEGRTRMPGNNGFSTMPVRPGMTFDTETMPVRPGMTFDIETMPGKQNTDPGFDFLRSFIGQDQARTPSFDINQGQGALGRRSGEQLLRLQGGSGSMQNQQLQQELERRGIIPRGVQLPPV